MIDAEFTPRPARGRVYEGARRVRLSDVDPSGRLRFDSVARYLQDVAGDDLADSGGSRHETWVVRRTAIAVEHAPRFGEALALATWCSGTGGRWAERRTSLVGEGGGRVEAAALWVSLDRRTLVPARLSESFEATYAEAAGGRRVSSRLALPWALPQGAATRPWAVRATDLDVMGHVNNAAYWAAVEEVLPVAEAPVVAVVEHGAGIDAGDDVTLHVDGSTVWLVVDGDVRAVARSGPQPAIGG